MFYDKVKVLCDKKGISITELVKQLGWGGSVSTGWKNGAIPRPAKVKAIADFFGVDVSHFSDIENVVINSSHFVQGNQNTVTFGNDEKTTRALTEIEAELLRLCGAMDTKQKNELLNFAYSFFDKK